MIPFVTILSFEISVQILLLIIYVAWAIRFSFKRAAEVDPKITRSSLVVLVLSAAYFAFIGGRIFYLLFENPNDFSAAGLNSVWQAAGRVFYGALLGGAFGVFVNTRFADRSYRFEYWNGAASVAAMGYGILRLGCFANGCCWGRMSDAPWAVQFNHPLSAMPYSGVPVHPVQLYDSVLGFLIYFILVKLRKKGISQATGFLILYAVGRFITEMFRGDFDRGVNVVGPLSMAQVHSLVLLSAVALFAVGQRILSIVKTGSRELLKLILE